MKIDLHMHSTVSDGELTPEEIVDWAIEKKMVAIAITDHEVLSGSREAYLYSKGEDIQVIPGIEIGADDEAIGLFDIHIVGLFIDFENERLKSLCEELKDNRVRQKILMIDKLIELGYDISLDELKAEVTGESWGRPHIAKILIRKYPEKFPKFQDVFDQLLGSDGTAFVRQKKRGIKETIEIIHAAGGVAFLAHPGFYDKKMVRVIDDFVALGGDGIEVDYFYGEDVDSDLINSSLRGLAVEKGILVSGGSDFHLKDSVIEIGDRGISEEEFNKMKDFVLG